MIEWGEDRITIDVHDGQPSKLTLSFEDVAALVRGVKSWVDQRQARLYQQQLEEDVQRIEKELRHAIAEHRALDPDPGWKSTGVIKKLMPRVYHPWPKSWSDLLHLSLPVVAFLRGSVVTVQHPPELRGWPPLLFDSSVHVHKEVMTLGQYASKYPWLWPGRHLLRAGQGRVHIVEKGWRCPHLPRNGEFIDDVLDLTHLCARCLAHRRSVS